MPRRHGLRLVMVAAIAIATAGCGSSTSTPPSDSASGSIPASGSAVPTAAAQAPDLAEHAYVPSAPTTSGGSLAVGGWEWPSTLLPYFSSQNSDLQLSSAMFDGLVKIAPDMRYVPNLVSELPTLANGGVVVNGSAMDVTWNLKLGMKWSDEDPITCDDIKATWQWIMDSANNVSTVGWRDVTGVDGGSGNRCVMHFGRIYEGYLTLVDPLLPGHYIQSVPVAQARTKLYSLDNVTAGVYSGPYVPVSVTAHSQINFKPNPQYATIAGHAPYLDGVQWKFLDSVSTMARSFAAGDLSFAQDMTGEDLGSLSGIPAEQIVQRDSQTYELLAFNNASFKTKFGDDGQMIVRAIQKAIDRAAIASGPLGGTVSPASSFVPATAWYYHSYPSASSFDPVGSRDLLANMGWTTAADGYLTKNGKVLAVDLCTTPRQIRLNTMTMIASELKAVGVRANVHTVAPSTMFAPYPAKTTAGVTPPLCALSQGNFDIAEFSYVSMADPAVGYATYVSTQTPEATTPGHTGQNITRILNAELDKDYQTIVSSVDPTTIAAAMASVQNVYASDQNTFELPLYFVKDVWLVSPKLHNFVGGFWPLGGTWNIGDWWLG